VLTAARTGGVEPLLLDVASLESAPFVATSSEVRISGRDTTWRLESGAPVRGWIRRLAPEDWRLDDPPASHGGVVRAAWMTLLVSFTKTLGIDWLSDIDKLFVAEHKLVQYACAARAGIRVPRTAVASTRELIPPELGDSFVVKALGPGDFLEAGGAGRVVFATELRRTAEELEDLGGAPFLLQETLPAASHLRVVTVGDRGWACELIAAEMPLDWRREAAAHESFRPTADYPEVIEMGLRLAAMLDVGYTSQDWMITAGDAVFLDLNPGGQWLFLPEPVATEVTQAIADWLTGTT
jgi:glutathione synthase/RimK-type ligase-like ATP-grasp enzyme